MESILVDDNGKVHKTHNTFALYGIECIKYRTLEGFIFKGIECIIFCTHSGVVYKRTTNTNTTHYEFANKTMLIP